MVKGPGMHARVQPSLYQQLESLPPGLIGEILNGQLHTQPRPSGRHAYALSDGAWRETGRFSDCDQFRAAPFDAVVIALDDLWAS